MNTARMLEGTGFRPVSAVTAAVLAVLAAIGSLLSAGHAVNQAILEQTKATDQWAFYQAKSTKSHVYQVGGGASSKPSP